MKHGLLIAIALLAFFSGMGLAHCQSPIHVTPCDLVNSPEKYAGKLVEVRARINLAFEAFSLAQPGCEQKHPSVWLMYGGDEDTPTASTWNDHDRKPGSVVKIDGIPIPLVHDADLDLFKNRLAAIRLGMIGDTRCYSDCHLYDVTATLTGLFFAARDAPQEHRGYGHLGCCHLLAIEKVAHVVAERSPIPAGAIRCSVESKDLTQRDADRLNSDSTTCEGLSEYECNHPDFRQMEEVAALWGDSLDFRTGFLDADISYLHTEKSGWLTWDHLKHYELVLQSENSDGDVETIHGGTATRVLCKEITPAPPISETGNQICRDINKKLRSTPADRKFNPKHLGEDLSHDQEENRSLKDAAAASVDTASSELGLPIDPGAKTVTCEPPLVYRGKEIGSCSWNNDTGTILMGVGLIRPWPQSKNADHNASSWALTGTSATVCEFEKQP